MEEVDTDLIVPAEKKSKHAICKLFLVGGTDSLNDRLTRLQGE